MESLALGAAFAANRLNMLVDSGLEAGHGHRWP